MTKRTKLKWADMSNGKRATVIGVAAVDAALRVWAGSDLAGRPAAQVNGPKWLWGAGLTVVSSSGVLPAAYLILGRKRS